MEYLSWLFFCVSPFALFCSDSGDGLILCPICIILGFVFKRAGSRSGKSGVVVKVDPKHFWEWEYIKRITPIIAKRASINDELMAARDKEAREWATTICRYHNVWIPPESIQEQIARANGVVTESMVREKVIKKDRIQIGKYYLVRELYLKYENRKKWRISLKIKDDMNKIESNSICMCDWNIKREYGMTVSEMWKDLSPEEKEQVLEWFKEYAEKRIQTIEDYESRREFVIRSIEMDF